MGVGAVSSVSKALISIYLGRFEIPPDGFFPPRMWSSLCPIWIWNLGILIPRSRLTPFLFILLPQYILDVATTSRKILHRRSKVKA